MKPNNDCIRDVLLYCEKNTGINRTKPCQIKGRKIIVDEILRETYSLDEISFVILYLVNNHFLSQCNSGTSARAININNITADGYKLLEQIRDNSTWSKIKTALINQGCTLGASASSSIIEEIIKKCMFL